MGHTRVTPAMSTEPADWLRKALTTFGENVGSVVPARFDAYVRIFHPAHRGGEAEVRVLWAEVAESNGKTFHPLAQWLHIAFDAPTAQTNYDHGPPGAIWESAPSEGHLPVTAARTLIAILSQRTDTPSNSLFAVWEGWGGLEEEMAGVPHFGLPARGYFLLEGPIEAAAETFYPDGHDQQSAALWWPSDQSWCVATEVDFESTYVGGSRECIDAILAASDLEALEVSITDGITWASDVVNAPE